MQNTLLINESHNWTNKQAQATRSTESTVFGRKLSLMAKLFGCWHKNISRPFTQENTAYRSCLDCGARRQFNPETLKTYGTYYFPPVIKTEHV